MRGTGVRFAGFYFEVPRQQKKKTEILLSLGSGRISCASFLAGKNEDSSTQSSPRTGQAAPRSKHRWKRSGCGPGRKITQVMASFGDAVDRPHAERRPSVVSAPHSDALLKAENYLASADRLQHMICHSH